MVSYHLTISIFLPPDASRSVASPEGASVATEEPAPEKARFPWSPWASRRAKPPSPTADDVTVESGSDGGDDEQSPWPDVPELNLDEDVAGDVSTEPLEDRPGGGGEGSAVDASPRVPPMGRAQSAGDEGRLALGRPVHTPSTDGAAEAPAATATAAPVIPMEAEGRSLAVITTHISGLGASSSSGNPGRLAEGHAIFAQARQVVNQMEKALATCQEELRTREAELSAREAKMVQAEAAFRENARQSTERLCAREAGITTEAQQLSRLREELRITEERLAAERLSLVTREAEAEERHRNWVAKCGEDNC